MPLASDARPRGGAREAREGGKGALRWSAPMVNTSRPEPATRRRGTRRYPEDATPENQQIGARASTSGRGARGVSGRGDGARVSRRDRDRIDCVIPDSHGGEDRAEEERFDRAFAALAEEMEKELIEMSPTPVPRSVARLVGLHDADRSLDTETDASVEGLPDASSFRAASRTAIGEFIREFRGVAASDVGRTRHWCRDDAADDDDFLSASPVFDPARGARALRRVETLASASINSSRTSDGWHSPSERDSDVRRSGGFLASTDDMDGDIAWARWGGGRGITIVETDHVPLNRGRPALVGSADPMRVGKGGVDAPFDDAAHRRDDKDILEAWRRQRRREAMEKGDEASYAARAAAAVAALELGTGDAGGSKYARSSDAGDAAAGKPESPPSATRRRMSPDTLTCAASAVAFAVQTESAVDTVVTTPSHARRSLEFQEKRRDGARLIASAAALSTLSTSPASSPTPSQRAAFVSGHGFPESNSTSGAATPETPSPCPSPGRGEFFDENRKQSLERAVESPDIAAVIDVTVGDALFGFDDDETGAAAATDASLHLDVPNESTAVYVGQYLTGVGLPPRAAPPPGELERSGGDANRRVSTSSKPPRPAPFVRRDVTTDTGLSPIEVVAAEVPDRPPLRSVPPVDTRNAAQTKVAATAAAVAAAAAAANPWLPSNVAAPKASTAFQEVTPPVSRDTIVSPSRRFGLEWARPEDEDDGLVVMLKARVENLEGQIARVLAESKRKGLSVKG